jgi:glutamate-ammonia-ligase adenylyltransferase
LLVQTEAAYVEYFAASAKAWEGIAYMKARAVAGDIERGTGFLYELQREMVWRRHGQGGQAKSELRQMRMRLQREQGKATPLKAGEGGYYDADFILMYLRLRGAGLFYNSLNTPERIEVVEKMGHLEREDAEFLMTATTYFRALDHAIRLVKGRAEEKIPGAPAHRVMVSSLLRRWMGRPALMTDFPTETLETELASVQSRMRRLFEQVFGSTAGSGG